MVIMKTKAQTRAFLSRHIEKHEHELGMSHAQAVAAALEEARKKGYAVRKR